MAKPAAKKPKAKRAAKKPAAGKAKRAKKDPKCAPAP